MFAVHAGELLGEEAELASSLFVEAPDGIRLLFGDVELLDGSFVVGEKLVERDFQGAREFFQSLDGGNGAAVFQAREITAKQAGAFLDIALREILRLAQPFEPFADNHGRELTIVCRADSIIVEGETPRVKKGRPRCRLFRTDTFLTLIALFPRLRVNG